MRNIIAEAAAYAKSVHKDQKRKDGKPYFTHLQAVALIVATEWQTLIPRVAQDRVAQDIWDALKDHVIAAAYLHDSMEDQGVTAADLSAAGFSELTISMVEALTRKPDENYFDFIMRIKDAGPALVSPAVIKLADLKHNMSDLAEGSLKDKYRFAQYILTH